MTSSMGSRPMYEPIEFKNALDSRFTDYLNRVLDLKQMDFESAFDQMTFLFTTDPQRVYVSSLFINTGVVVIIGFCVILGIRIFIIESVSIFHLFSVGCLVFALCQFFHFVN